MLYWKIKLVVNGVCVCVCVCVCVPVHFYLHVILMEPWFLIIMFILITLLVGWQNATTKDNLRRSGFILLYDSIMAQQQKQEVRGHAFNHNLHKKGNGKGDELYAPTPAPSNRFSPARLRLLITLPSSAINWSPSKQMLEPMGDISHANHHTDILKPTW